MTTQMKLFFRMAFVMVFVLAGCGGSGKKSEKKNGDDLTRQADVPADDTATGEDLSSLPEDGTEQPPTDVLVPPQDTVEPPDDNKEMDPDLPPLPPTDVQPDGQLPPGPPLEAYEACKGKEQGDICSFVTPRGEKDGTCELAPDNKLACMLANQTEVVPCDQAEPGEPCCGNGTCDDNEDEMTCPPDCGGGGGECGNDKCEPGEQESCPQDCQGMQDGCTTDDDCKGPPKCPPEISNGCVCALTQMGQKMCVPACDTVADCPSFPGVTFICTPEGYCEPKQN